MYNPHNDYDHLQTYNEIFLINILKYFLSKHLIFTPLRGRGDKI